MSESRKWWGEPVPVSIEGEAVRTMVNNTAQAVRILIEEWPAAKVSTHRHLAARRACLDVLQGLKPVVAARQAFREAAEEAGMLRERAGDRPPAPAGAEGPKLWRKRRHKLKRDM